MAYAVQQAGFNVFGEPLGERVTIPFWTTLGWVEVGLGVLSFISGVGTVFFVVAWA